MKTLLKILAIIIILILASLFIIPMVYKSELVAIAKNELNNSVDATVDFKDIDISLFRNFPDFNLRISDISAIGKNEFTNDTVLIMESLELTFDVMSVFSGDNYEIKKIRLNKPVFNLYVPEKGKANYDILKYDSEDSSEVETTESTDPLILNIKSFSINSGKLYYNDEDLKTNIVISGIDHELSGNLSLDDAVLNTKTRASSVTVDYDGVRYLSNVSLFYQANIIADLKNEIYKLGKNELVLNNLFIGFDGSVSYIGDDLNLVLTFSSKGKEFKDLISLIPDVYKSDFNNIEASGSFAIQGSVKGIYNENSIPSFSIEASVNNGMFRYSELPGKIESITLDSKISNTGGTLDNTVVSVSNFSFKMGKNTLKASLDMKSPISNPFIDTKLNFTFNLNELINYYPIDSASDLSGKLIADLNFKGFISDIETGNYGNFLAMGSMVANDITYVSAMLPDPVKISNAQLNFSPKYIDLVDLSATSGSSDLKASGKLNNYIPYYLKDENLTGNIKLHSKFLNVDDLVKEMGDHDDNSSEQEVISDTSSSSSSFELPKNIGLTINSTFNKLIYDNLEMEKVKGIIILKDGVLNLERLRMDVVGGTMVVSGKLSTADPKKPDASLKFNLSEISFARAFEQFALIKKYLPLAEKTKGMFSASLDFSTSLNSELIPDYSTLVGEGNIKTGKIGINGLNTMTELAQTLKVDKLQNLEINGVTANFKFQSGKLVLKPTKFKYGKIDSELYGTTGLDQSIDYDMKMKIPRSELGSDANQVIDNLMSGISSSGFNISVPETIPVDIKITGTLSKPKIQSKLGSISNSAIQVVEKEIREEIGESAKNIISEAEAQAKKLLEDARKQSDLIKANAADAIKLLDKETDKQIDALMAEAKKNGFVAEMAAKEAAKRLQKETDSKKQELLNEATKKADNLLKDAEKKSEDIIKEANKKAEKTTGK